MIKGLGIDIVENKRIRNVYDLYGFRFVKKILGTEEIKEFSVSKNQISFLAKRFASKEALSKSLGFGLYRKNLYPNTLQVGHDENGKPFFLINKSLAKIFKELEINDIFLSISDTENYSTAIVVTEKNEYK